MSRKRKKNKLPEALVRVTITGLTHDGRGVARVNEKAVFVEEALPGEEVSFQYAVQRKSYDVGVAVEVHQPSPHRVTPKCSVFGVCGGCAMQHLEPQQQIIEKEKVLLEDFRRIGKVEPQEIVAPLTANHWGYRRKARLGVRYVEPKGRVLVGFRERRKSFITVMDRCEVLAPSVGENLSTIGDLIYSLDARSTIAQIEVAVDDTQTALVFRNLEPLSDADTQKLIDFAKSNNYAIYLQPKGPDSVIPLWPESITLQYSLPEYNVNHTFAPTDFTQVNYEMNQKMIARAIEWLAPQKEERVLDLFCGIGNFTLPLTRFSDHVVGVEGSDEQVARAQTNAIENGIHNVEYHQADLSNALEQLTWWKQGFDKVLLDPARDGAMEAIPYIAKVGAKRIVYVSCNPATLARDAGMLVNDYGYKLVKAGVMDMFPHTAHVESIALFEK